MIIEPKTICVDFDQTLCDSIYPDVGPPKKGAKEAMQALKAMGYYIIVSSCRSCSWNWDIYYGDIPHIHAKDRLVYQEMVNWLDENKIPYDLVDDGTKGKVSAHLYVDDKGYRFENNWDAVVKFVEKMENGTKS